MKANRTTALITGASTGIGKELAYIHAEQGGDLIIVARGEEKLLQLKDELEGKFSSQVTVIPKDLTSPNAAQDIYDEIKGQGLQVDYLINNAGFGGHGKFYERSAAEDAAMIQLNIVVLTELCRLFLPDFVERNSGRVLNVSSTASLPPGGPLQSVYFATKHFVTALSYGIAGELEGTGVTVTALLPGATATEFAESAGLSDTELFAKAFPPRQVAQDGYEAMLEGKLDVISGLTFGQKMQMRAMPFMPKRTVLHEIYKMQQLED
ncbi:MAG: SDR family oxidoreductase [Verrucomicrobiota bacterium]